MAKRAKQSQEAGNSSAGVVAVITAIGSCATTIGMAVVIVISSWQAKTLKQVELQGNSRELETKRLIMVAYQRLAEDSKKLSDIAIYEDARKSYEEARKQTELATGK